MNGLRACLEKNFMRYLSDSNADIVAVQETRVSEPIEEIMASGYKSEWNHAERLGHSGTLCLFKDPPLAVFREDFFGCFDKEGRIIVLEYPNFYFVNVYIPHSQGDELRLDKRVEWDKKFLDYLTALQENKPVVAGGDFNVAREYIDIYPENYENIRARHGFLPEEREGFDNLLKAGFKDVFRELHPAWEHSYTWWNNRNDSRAKNKGRRLDYFLVSESLLPKVKGCIIRADVFGSDHAPLEISIDLYDEKDFGKNPEISKKNGAPAERILKPDYMKTRFSDEELTQKWRGIDWEKAEETLREYQKEISLAALRRDDAAVANLQRQLVNANDVKAIAVRHVCSSVAQPGVDGVKWTTDAQKMQAVYSLGAKEYFAQPMRFIQIRPKGQGAERIVQLPTVFDRAVQVCYALALDSVSEATGDRKSYAFRRGRSTHDVHVAVISAIEGEDAPRYLVKADVKAYYGTISHEWLLRHIPIFDKHALKEFLKAGHIFAGELFPADDFGISLGTSISPILGNMCLDGLQTAIFNGLNNGYYKSNIDFSNGNMIRFADDILVTARTSQTAEKILDIITDFLTVRGLALSEEKTEIIHLNSKSGFDFLSRHYEYKSGVITAKPSKPAVEKIKKTLRELILSHKGSQKCLIEQLNKKLTGWANYHRITDAKTVFAEVDMTVKALLLQLCEKLHPTMPRKRVIQKYFYMENGEYIYAIPSKPDIRVVRLSDTILIKHTPLQTKKNPYLDGEYYNLRTGEREISNVTGKYKPIWERQGGKCWYCGKHIIKGENKTLVQMDLARPATPRNQAYVHENCSHGQSEFYSSDFPVDTVLELNKLLQELNEDSISCEPGKKYKFSPLGAYFRRRNDNKFTLAFDEIEKIMGSQLCDSAKKFIDYWYRKGELRISAAWHYNGYKIHKLDLENRRVSFEKVKNYGEALEIPEIFLSGRIPANVKIIIENFFKHIKTKYGL